MRDKVVRPCPQTTTRSMDIYIFIGPRLEAGHTCCDGDDHGEGFEGEKWDRGILKDRGAEGGGGGL